MADAVNVKKLKVAELKKELVEHGLAIKGNKSELQARLEEFLQQQGVELQQSEEVEGDDDDDIEHDVDGELAEDSGDDLVVNESPVEEKTIDVELSAEPQIEEKTDVASLEQENLNGEAKSESQEEHHKIVLQSPSTVEERKLQRIKRFGETPSDKDRKSARAERFGTRDDNGKIRTPSTPKSPTDVSVLKKRAERFGVISPAVGKVVDSEKMLKRKERFGVSTISSPSDSLEIKKKKRAERFGV